MCTITLSYNEKDKAASEKLKNSASLPEEKEFYTPEDLREILVNDLNEYYGVKSETKS